MKNVILASKSPRRLEILRNHGIEPIVLPSEADETLPDGIGMTEAVELLAEKKAQACYQMISTNNYEALNNIKLEDTVILGSDTIVFKNEIMGKPQNAEEAFTMLSSIRNTSHYVATGVAIVDAATGISRTLHDITEVFCKNYSDEDINEYISSGEPFDKAGAYAIQGGFGKHIDHINGDYENVVGLPFHIIEDYLK